MAGFAYEKRVARCGELIRAQELDVLLLAKPSNMFYLTGDGRLCAYAMLTQEGKVALGVLSTDVADVSVLARFDRIAGLRTRWGCSTPSPTTSGSSAWRVASWAWSTPSSLSPCCGCSRTPTPSPRVWSRRMRRPFSPNSDW